MASSSTLLNRYGSGGFHRLSIHGPDSAVDADPGAGRARPAAFGADAIEVESDGRRGHHAARGGSGSPARSRRAWAARLRSAKPMGRFGPASSGFGTDSDFAGGFACGLEAEPLAARAAFPACTFSIASASRWATAALAACC